jgi:hypothetical protein
MLKIDMTLPKGYSKKRSRKERLIDMALTVGGSTGTFLVFWFFRDSPIVKEIANILSQI